MTTTYKFFRLSEHHYPEVLKIIKSRWQDISDDVAHGMTPPEYLHYLITTFKEVYVGAFMEENAAPRLAAVSFIEYNTAIDDSSVASPIHTLHIILDNNTHSRKNARGLLHAYLAFLFEEPSRKIIQIHGTKNNMIRRFLKAFPYGTYSELPNSVYHSRFGLSMLWEWTVPLWEYGTIEEKAIEMAETQNGTKAEIFYGRFKAEATQDSEYTGACKRDDAIRGGVLQQSYGDIQYDLDQRPRGGDQSRPRGNWVSRCLVAITKPFRRNKSGPPNVCELYGSGLPTPTGAEFWSGGGGFGQPVQFDFRPVDTP